MPDIRQSVTLLVILVLLVIFSSIDLNILLGYLLESTWGIQSLPVGMYTEGGAEGPPWPLGHWVSNVALFCAVQHMCKIARYCYLEPHCFLLSNFKKAINTPESCLNLIMCWRKVNWNYIWTRQRYVQKKKELGMGNIISIELRSPERASSLFGSVSWLTAAIWCRGDGYGEELTCTIMLETQLWPILGQLDLLTVINVVMTFSFIYCNVLFVRLLLKNT